MDGSMELHTGIHGTPYGDPWRFIRPSMVVHGCGHACPSAHPWACNHMPMEVHSEWQGHAYGSARATLGDPEGIHGRAHGAPHAAPSRTKGPGTGCKRCPHAWQGRGSCDAHAGAWRSMDPSLVIQGRPIGHPSAMSCRSTRGPIVSLGSPPPRRTRGEGEPSAPAWDMWGWRLHGPGCARPPWSAPCSRRWRSPRNFDRPMPVVRTHRQRRCARIRPVRSLSRRRRPGSNLNPQPLTWCSP